MKKTYMNPSIEVEMVLVENGIAASQGINPDTGDFGTGDGTGDDW